MSALYQAPELSQIRQLLSSIERIAVIGISPKTNRPSHRVAQALQSFGYQIVPVRPGIKQVLGEQAYANITQVAGPVDLVDVFRAPEHVDAIVDDCIAMNIPAIWLQDGVINEPAAARAQHAGIFVVMDRCIYRDYQQLGITD